ncbi:MAG: NAD(P)-dependent oxidoreductase [Alphaproteobacteria bacterium]|nr:NAD(P)-dependent oxidoreductase [Alphaproteobacteria bacterium]
MSTKTMLKFVERNRQMPHKRSAEERAKDFGEIYDGFQDQEAKDQASRCSQCGVPFCQVNCPLHNNIPDWLMMTAEGRLEEAYELSSATNSMPEICGRICPQDRLCEGNCVIETSGHETVTIGSVEKFITDSAWENGWVSPIVPLSERGESIGIIGAGPGGLAAAAKLRERGYQVHIYDRYDRVGGLLVYGIPSFKLEKDVVARRHLWLVDSGVEFHLGVNIGEDVSFEELRKRHDAVLIATGVYKARDLKAPGVGLKNIYPALTYLTASNRKGLGDQVAEYDNGNLNAEGKNVVVIGGGDTAMDCVRTAIRQGAKSVKCLYRRDEANMPGSARETANAKEEGVEFVWLSNPEAFVGNDKDELTGVKAVSMRLGPPDATGRRQPRPIEGSSVTHEADIALLALGFEPEDLPTLWGQKELEVTNWGTLRVDHNTSMTAMDGVFAVGDIVRGASLVVWAVKDGHDAASHIDDYVSAKSAVAAE